EKEEVKKQKAFGKMSDDNYQAGENEKDPSFDFQILKKAPARGSGPISDWVKRNYDIPEGCQDADVFKVIRALCGWRKVDKTTEAALATLKTVSGTATLTEHLSAQLFESGVARSHLGRSGMQTFLMDEPTVRFPQITAFPTVEWLTQGATQSEKSVTLASVDGIAATSRSWTSLPAELAQDGHNVHKLIRRAFSTSIATEIDRAGLYGSGSGEEPLGVANYVGLPVYELDGLITGYSPFIEAQKLVYDEDGPDLTHWIGSPDFWLQITKLTGTNEFQPVAPPFDFAARGVKWLQTSKAPQDEGASGNNSSIIGGGFSSLHLGIRLNSSISITHLTADSYSYNILGVMRSQFFAERVEDFAKISKVHPDTVT
ncbi:MAG: phage major capsid protein, partial [Cyclobacteriaceae bacterium]